MSTSDTRHFTGLFLARRDASETLASIQPALMYLIEVCRPGKSFPGGYR